MKRGMWHQAAGPLKKRFHYITLTHKSFLQPPTISLNQYLPDRFQDINNCTGITSNIIFPFNLH